jgi:glutamate--cysteine ligase
MARDQSDETPIDGRDELVGWFAQGCKPRSAYRIGTEHEKIGFYSADLGAVAYAGRTGIEALLQGVREGLGWQPIEDRGHLIGLADDKGGGAISLEPGGQFELSGAPLATLHGTKSELDAHLDLVGRVAARLGIGFLSVGESPTWTRDQIPRMPKQRYQIMLNYMPKVGTMGVDMMLRTATVQVNLDFSSEADMVKKLRVSVALQPIATAIFANSPFSDGRPNGFLSMRSEIWRHTDAARTGMIPWAFEDGMGFERYADWALDVPMYFVKRGDSYIDVAGQSFRDLLAGRLPQLPGERATISDWANHLSTLFPEVRLKRYLEMRGADAGPAANLVALSAFWVGLIYDDAVLDAAWNLVKDWTEPARQALRDDVPRLALDARIAGRSVLDVARDALALSREGLTRRAARDASGADESGYLAPIEAILERGRPPAADLLERFNGAWGGSLAPLFAQEVY